MFRRPPPPGVYVVDGCVQRSARPAHPRFNLAGFRVCLPPYPPSKGGPLLLALRRNALPTRVHRKSHSRAGWRPRQPRWPCTVSEQFPVATENHIDARVSRMQRRARRGGVQGGAGARPPLGWECEDAPGKRSGTARSAREPPGRRRELPEAAGERQGAARSARGPPGSRREPPWERRPNLGAPGTQSSKWIST